SASPRWASSPEATASWSVFSQRVPVRAPGLLISVLAFASRSSSGTGANIDRSRLHRPGALAGFSLGVAGGLDGGLAVAAFGAGAWPRRTGTAPHISDTGRESSSWLPRERDERSRAQRLLPGPSRNGCRSGHGRSREPLPVQAPHAQPVRGGRQQAGSVVGQA